MFQHPVSSFTLFMPATLFVVAGIYAILGLYGWHNRASPAAKTFTWLMLAMGIWSLGYGMEISPNLLQQKMFWARVEYPGIVAVSVLWLKFALEYTEHTALLTRRNQILLWVIPVTIVALFWTDEIHHLVWQSVVIIQNNGLSLLDPEYGPMFWVHISYSYVLLLAGSAVLIVRLLRAPFLYRAQVIVTIIAVIIPVMGNIFYVFGLIPNSEIDFTPFFFLPSGLVLAWGITRYRLLDVVPPAQNVILQSLRNGVILLDRKHRVLYMNHAAETIFGGKADESLGQPIEQICGGCSAAVAPFLDAGETRIEKELEVAGSLRQFEINISPMQSFEKFVTPETVSHLLIFQDITERKEAEFALHRRDVILRAVSLASEQFMKSASWEKNIQTVLEQMGRAASASRAYIFESRISDDGAALLSQKYEWVAEGIQSQIDNPKLNEFPWREVGYARWADELEQHRMISGIVREFPVSEQAPLQQQGILSLVIIPIFVDETFWGFIGFDDCLSERQWSESELDALRAAAGIFGAALERRNIELRLIKRQHSQTLLQEIIRAALGKSDINEVAQFLVDHLGSLIGADQCFLSRWDEAREQVIPLAVYGVPLEQYLSMTVQPGEKTLTASALESGQMLVVEDAQDSANVSLSLARLFGTRSLLAIPMISNERKLGAVLLGFLELHRFTPEEIIISEQAAELITLAFAKIQAVEEAQRRAEEAETLRRAGAAISETLNLQEATTRILEQLAFVLPHDSASIQLLRGNELEIIGGEGWSNPDSIVGLRFPIPANNPNTVVIETRKPYLLKDVHEAFPEFRNIVHASHIRSWLGVPLIVHNQLIGLLAIDSRETSHFTADDAELATAFAGHVAVAIENARLFNEVQQLAITDGLTGLYNRRYFMELAQNEFERSRRYKRHLSVMMFDIDHFKIVNDTYGHPFGDKVLQAIANLCKEKLREVDPIARYGGEEFIALIVETSLVSTKKVAERLRLEVEKMITHHARVEVRVTISIGLAEQNKDTLTLETLIARADQAMYAAKHKGRNRVFVGR